MNPPIIIANIAPHHGSNEIRQIMAHIQPMVHNVTTINEEHMYINFSKLLQAIGLYSKENRRNKFTMGNTSAHKHDNRSLILFLWEG